MTKDFDQAIKFLISCIDEGMEYPEAHWATIAYFDLTTKQGEILTDLYDECGGILK